MTKTNHNVSIVAGGAGFIGTNVCMRLLQEKRIVFVIDNFSKGKPVNFDRVGELASKLKILHADLADRLQCEAAFNKASAVGVIDEVWHLAANSDIQAGILDSDIDYKDTFLTTYELLRVLKRYDVPKFYFASSSAIYGDLDNQILYENIGPLNPISNYGAMKLASESIISATVESGPASANIFRFPNVVGLPATHGVILDFLLNLKANSNFLKVLGDGSQKKAYMHVSDLVDAMFFVRGLSLSEKFFSINIGPIDEGVLVSWIAERVVNRVSPNAAINYGIGNKGWIGDVPKFIYSVDKLLGLGWRPSLSSKEAVIRAIDEIADHMDF
jgi:UDP-glucose 4-epimerase